MVQPIWVAAAGHACLYEPTAISFEAGSRNLGDELKRRSRIIGRGIRGIRAVLPAVASQRAGLLATELLSRKGLRYLTPLWFFLLLVGAGLAPGAFYKTLFVLQLLVYVVAIPAGFLLPDGRVKHLLSPAVYFGIGNLAALLGWWKVLTGSELGRWQTAERPYETGASAQSGAQAGS
jgi:hypothetical protein